MAPSGVGKALAGLGMVAVGAAAGVAAERALISKKHKNDMRGREPFGQLRGNPQWVSASDGIQLYVEVDDPLLAPPDDLAIVFCHGYALNQDCFHFQRKNLRGKATLVFWDQRSHGKSDEADAEHVSIDQLGDDLYRVIQATVPDRPVILVGHSMGGMTLMALADQHPEMFSEDGNVKGVALLATSAGQLNSELFGLPNGIASKIHGMAPALSKYALQNAVAIDRGREYTSDFATLLTHRFSFGSDAPAAYGEFTSEMLNETSFTTVVQFLATLDAHDKVEALRTFDQVDTVVMVGEQDVLTPISHYARIVREVPTARTRILPNTGHMLILERHFEVDEALDDLVHRVRIQLDREAK